MAGEADLVDCELKRPGLPQILGIVVEIDVREK